MKKVFQIFFVLFLAAASYAETCIECHTYPKYKKEDSERLKECLRCHGSSGHPLKERHKGAVPAAFAEEKPNKSPGKKPDLSGMVRIPEGEFLMGSDDRLRDEKPGYVTYSGAFYMDRYEVQNGQYKKFIAAAGHAPPDDWDNGKIPKGKEKNPVIFVTWYDASSYCKWAGKRLPREIEWEKAARGTDGRIYPWGSVWDMNKSNNPIRGHEGTMPVGSFEGGKSPYGLYDMSGNVWEWVDDEYLPHPGSDYASPEFIRGYKLLKGGSWWDCMFYGCGISAPAFNRSFFDAATKNDSFGFRCAADVK